MVDPDFYRGFEYQIICSPKISSFHKGIIEITLFSQRSISYGLGSVSKQFRVPNMAGPRRVWEYQCIEYNTQPDHVIIALHSD